MDTVTHSRTRHPAFAKIEAKTYPKSVPEILDKAADLFGDREAIAFFERDESMSYSDLHSAVYRLADALHTNGIRKGTHVALMLSNRIEYPVVWLALGVLGAVSVPVISGSTAREIAFIAKDAEVEYVVVEDGFLSSIVNADVFPDSGKIVVVGTEVPSYLNYSQLIASGTPDFRPTYLVESSDLLNIQYTSGTTGLPKGVMQNHRFWVLAGAIPAEMLPDLQSILSDHPWHYIDPQWMLVSGLYAGARVDFTNGMSVRKFHGWLESRGSSLVWFPDPLLKFPETEQDKKNQVQLFMGYHLSSDMQQSIEKRFNAPVREFYGMTEIAMGIGVPLDCSDPAALGSCGVPAPFRNVRIVDSDGVDVPFGEIGELWISGDGMFSGYYNRPEANEQFFADGWFRTGDLFCQDANGYFHIVGRIKDMIKRSGENIAALEVEQVLMELALIEEAAVVAVPDSDRDQEVKAYIKLCAGTEKAELHLDVILAHCHAHLAKFKAPRYIEFVNEFPYTPSNKVAKHLLVKGVDDLRTNSYDFADKIWR